MKSAVLDGGGDGQVVKAQLFYQPRLQPRHGDFLGTKVLSQLLTGNGFVINRKLVIMNLVANYDVGAGVFELFDNALELVNAVGLVIDGKPIEQSCDVQQVFFYYVHAPTLARAEVLSGYWDRTGSSTVLNG